MYICIELLLESYKTIKDLSNCKNHDEIIQGKQQQHRYIVSFDSSILNNLSDCLYTLEL